MLWIKLNLGFELVILKGRLLLNPIYNLIPWFRYWYRAFVNISFGLNKWYLYLEKRDRNPITLSVVTNPIKLLKSKESLSRNRTFWFKLYECALHETWPYSTFNSWPGILSRIYLKIISDDKWNFFSIKIAYSRALFLTPNLVQNTLIFFQRVNKNIMSYNKSYIMYWET